MELSPLAALRREYTLRDLSESSVDADPLRQFQVWFDEAVSAAVDDPTAMTLATVAADGRPSARIVLLKGASEEGFVFYTNYDSAKGRDLIERPYAALVFWWAPLERQVRVSGPVERVPEQESEAYFRSRPRGSRIGAWVSAQSRVIGSREELEARTREIEQEYEGREVPRPPYWGGFVVRPEAYEFWQGRPSRLHDRLRFTRSGDAWTIERLAP